MRRLLLVILFAAIGVARVNAQALVQTYVDRCTGQVHVFTVPMNGQTVVAFYDKSRTFTAQEFTDGTLQAWLEQTYQWWSALSPCSTNQATTSTTQQTTTQATSQATTAATNATQNTTTNATTGSTSTGSTNSTGTTGGSTSGNTNSGNTGSGDNSSSSGTGGGGTEGGSSDTSSGSSSSDTGGSSGDGNSGDGGSSGDGGGSGGEEGSGGGEESKNEESTEQKSEEKTEESSEEKEEVEKEESKEEEKEEEKEETTEDTSEEEEEKKEEKKKKLAPPIVAANLVTMSMLDGTLSQAASFGYSQSSLTGLDTYNVNGMIWSNLQQYSINISKSHVFFNYDKPRDIIIKNAFGEEVNLGTVNEKGSIMKVQSISTGYMRMFTSHIVTTGISDVYLGQKDNFWKGFAGGFAANGMFMFAKETPSIFLTALTLFGTKPFIFKWYPRLTISPMLAYSATPFTIDLESKQVYFSEHGSYVIGSNFDFNLTQRFKANIGFTTIGSTIKNVPISWALTVGSRFAF